MVSVNQKLPIPSKHYHKRVHLKLAQSLLLVWWNQEPLINNNIFPLKVCMTSDCSQPSVVRFFPINNNKYPRAISMVGFSLCNYRYGHLLTIKSLKIYKKHFKYVCDFKISDQQLYIQFFTPGTTESWLTYLATNFSK